MSWEKFTGRRRRDLEDDEATRLGPWACPSTEASRSGAEKGEDPLRPAFQRDRDRILHSRAFRRLKHKTQVFVPHLADHPRTRLTHTLEVAQLGRTIARALALNEDLVEAIALGHDLGHTAFGHTGESLLKDLLGGNLDEPTLRRDVASRAGTFKHNYHSVRVVDLLERRYGGPGLGLTNQVREGILKHTGWTPDYDFPLPDTAGLRMREPCHLEGQTVAVADEIAQQTHDLEDGLRAKSVDLSTVEELKIARRVIENLGDAYCKENRRWLRQNLLIRGIIALFINDVIEHSATRIQDFMGAFKGQDHLVHSQLQPSFGYTMIWFSEDTQLLFDELKTFIYRFIINHPRVNRQDWRARKVMAGLFHAFWVAPLNLPTYVLLRARDELGFPFIRDLPMATVASEVRDRYHASSGFLRLVVDHLAGMTDRYALEEHRSLEQPALDQRFSGELE